MSSVSEENEVAARNERKLLWVELNRVVAPLYEASHTTTGLVRLVRMLDKLYVAAEGDLFARPGQIVWDRGRFGRSLIPDFKSLRAFAGRWHVGSLTEEHIRQLQETGRTYWGMFTPSVYDTGVFASMPMTAEIAEAANAVGLLDAATPYAPDGTLPRISAREGDMLCIGGWRNNTVKPEEHGVAYNKARWYPRAFFEERARYIDTLF